MSQVILGNIFGYSKDIAQADENLIRHLTLNSIRMYKNKFKKYGNVILVFDSGDYWRKEKFPQYKGTRRLKQDEKKELWRNLWNIVSTVRDELEDNFPYKVMRVGRAEADDIIAYLAKKYHQTEDIMIVSSDKDFQQLQRYENVKQYSPITKKFINGEDPTEYLYQHILKGDSSDGVPNVLSPDNTFVDGLRQRPLSKKKISEWAGPLCEQVLPNDELKRNYQRNKKLIDLQETPKELHLECIRTYQDAPEGDRSKLLNYFIKNRLNDLMENIGDF